MAAGGAAFFFGEGECADWAIHDSENDKGQCNLYIYVLLIMRPIMENGEWEVKTKKVFDLDENGKRIPIIDKKTGQHKVDRRNRTRADSRIDNRAGLNGGRKNCYKNLSGSMIAISMRLW